MLKVSEASLLGFTPGRQARVKNQTKCDDSEMMSEDIHRYAPGSKDGSGHAVKYDGR